MERVEEFRRVNEAADVTEIEQESDTLLPSWQRRRGGSGGIRHGRAVGRRCRGSAPSTFMIGDAGLINAGQLGESGLSEITARASGRTRVDEAASMITSLVNMTPTSCSSAKFQCLHPG
jgi:hypothetical protein